MRVSDLGQAPFIVHLHYAFQTRDTLVLILDFVNGGELFTRMTERTAFSEDEARFYICEVHILTRRHLIPQDHSCYRVPTLQGGYLP